MQYRRVLGLVAGFVVLTTLVMAEEVASVAQGARVRVQMSNEQLPLVGTLSALAIDSITLQVGKEKAPRVLSRAQVTALAVSAGQRSRGRGTLLGTGIGAVVGGVIGFAGGDDRNVETRGLTASENAVEGAGIFAVLGALIGCAVPPGERWQEVAVVRVRVSVLPVPGRGVK